MFYKTGASWLREKEVCGGKLPPATLREKLQFCLRLKKNEFIQAEDEIWQSLNKLGLKPGVSLFLENVKITKTQKLQGFNVACKWKRSFKGWSPEEGWFILTNLPDLLSTINAYKKREDIEEMFRDFKSGGYKLESTNVSGLRLISLILIISFAYSLATFQGQKVKRVYKSMLLESKNMGD